MPSKVHPTSSAKPKTVSQPQPTGPRIDPRFHFLSHIFEINTVEFDYMKFYLSEPVSFVYKAVLRILNTNSLLFI